MTERRFSPSHNPLCPRSQLFAYSGGIVVGGGKSFGDDDGRAPNRICRGDCNRLSRVSANLNQLTANPANGVKNGKSRSTGETDAASTVGLFRTYPCRKFCFHVCLVEREGQCAANRSEHRKAGELLR